jgi:cyclic pyranopterin phosphate synthase
MTTNGVLLSRFAGELFGAGIKRLNVSLDSLKPEKFAAITRRDCFKEVWRGIETAREVGFHPIKLNMVVMRGINDDEIADFARLTRDFPFHARFIEFMPFQDDAIAKRFFPASEILEILAREGRLIPGESENGSGPALHFAYPGAAGKIGLISPISNHFCGTCNRMRLTADGKLRACLFAAEETDVKSALRRGGSDSEIGEIILAAIRSKPERHFLEEDRLRGSVTRPMSAIGG